MKRHVNPLLFVMVLPSIFLLNCGFNGMCKKSSMLAEHSLGQTGQISH